jgi:hypothetical protein
MEDKIGLKKNSLFKNQSGTKQDKPEILQKKLKKFVIQDNQRFYGYSKN